VVDEGGLQLIAAVFLTFSGVVSDIQNKEFSKQRLDVSAKCPLQYNTGENVFDIFMAHDPPTMKLPISSCSLV